MTLKSNVRYWTRFWPKYWAARGPVGRRARMANSTTARYTAVPRCAPAPLGFCDRLIPTSTGRLPGPEHRGVAPQPLQSIEIPRLRMEQMDHHIHEIEQYPTALGQSLCVMRAVPQGLHRLGDGIRKTTDVGVRSTARHHEPIGRIGEAAEVEHHDLVPL